MFRLGSEALGNKTEIIHSTHDLDVIYFDLFPGALKTS